MYAVIYELQLQLVYISNLHYYVYPSYSQLQAISVLHQIYLENVEMKHDVGVCPHPIEITKYITHIDNYNVN